MVALFEKIPNTFALCYTEGRGKWEVPVYRCAPETEENYYIKRGGYYLKIHRKVPGSQIWWTSCGKTQVQQIIAPVGFSYDIKRAK